MMSSVGASVGYDHGSAVSPRYAAPFAVHRHPARGRIELVTVPAADTAAAEARAEMSRQ